MNGFSKICLSQKALSKNIKFINEVVGEDCELVSVVKGNAYGHGIETFVNMAFQEGVRSFAVFNSFEARRVFSTALDFKRIIIMGAVLEEDYNWLIENSIESYVFSFSRLNMLIETAKNKSKKCLIHIEIETGLNRTGFNDFEWNRLIEVLQENKEYIEVKGLCTHLAGAEAISNYYRIQQQLAQLKRAKQVFTTNNISYGKIHSACSAAIINYPETIGGLVRVGIMQYGFWPSKETKVTYLTKNATMRDPLKRVISWKSKVMTVKNIGAGEFVGYGGSYLSEEKMKIAIIPIGYSDGFSRSLSNKGKVLIKGHRVDVIGMVNMNLMIVDVSKIKEVSEGEEVVIIGQQKKQTITVASFSEFSNQLNYQLLARLPESIPRVKTD